MQKKQKGEEEEVFVIYLDKNPITLLAWFYYRYFKMQMAMFPLHSFFQSIDLAGNCIRQIKFLWNNKRVREEFHVGDELRSCLLESRDLVSTSSSYLHLWSGQRFLPYCFQGWQGRDAAATLPQGQGTSLLRCSRLKQIEGGKPDGLCWLLGPSELKRGLK